MDLYEQYGSQEADEDFDETQSALNKKHKPKQASTSSMASFLSSIGKKNLPSSSTTIRSTTKSKFNEELSTYRSLAQKEYNAIVLDDKENDVVSIIRLKLILFLNDFFSILCIDGVLATQSIRIKMLITNCL
jgi:hypothetical protein